MSSQPADRVPPGIVAVADYEAVARERLGEAAWSYLCGGSGDEWTLRENIAAWTRLPLRPRVLRDLSAASTAVTLFGTPFAAPILLAPVAFQQLAHPDGELATALAAAALDTGMVVSTQASATLEDIAARAQGRAPLWFQLYIQPDRAFTASLVQRAEQAGYRALVVTVDAPVNGMRYREQRAGFRLPAGIEAVNLRGASPSPPAPAGALLFGTPLCDAAPTWQDLAWVRSLTRLPLLVKGIMDPEDARRAVEAGADGIIVSNHGGRALDGVSATIDVLPDVLQAVPATPVLIDGGIRRGNDVLRALALGASAVLVGRPFVWGLATAGAPGVAHVIRLLRAELELAMALTGCARVEVIDRAVLRTGE